MTTPWQPGFQGVTVVPPGYNDPHNYSPVSQSQLVATTGAAGTALVNGMPTFLTWTAPNDANIHQFNLIASLKVTSLQTGGAVAVSWTNPGGTTSTNTTFAGGLGVSEPSTQLGRAVEPGTTVTVAQTSAQSAGAAVLFAEIWAA